ncbi:MAG TPA: polysaccharide deacetylase family protein [Myxococcota bacterium]|nr:polysaccharide deacetylase family protein [Myxococcota bacterium]
MIGYALVRDVGAQALHWSGWSAPGRRLRGKLSIATFHRVLRPEERAEYPLAELVVTPEELGVLLESLAERFTCTTLADAAERWRVGDDPERPLLALTFDDGQLDNATRALPVLAAHGVRASFFIVSSAAANGESLWHDRIAFALPRAMQRDAGAARALLSELSGESLLGSEFPRDAARVVERAKRDFQSAAGREAWIARLERAAGGAWRPAWDGMLRWDDLRALHAAGHEIGSHSHSHPLLPDCNDQELERELAQSKLEIERAIGAPVSSFCYPNGDSNPRVLAAVEKAGYARAVTTQHGWNARGAAMFALRRCDLTYAHCVDRSGRFSPARLAWRLGRS